MHSKSVQASQSSAVEHRALYAILGLAALLRLAFAAIFPDQSANLPDSIAYRNAALDLLAGHKIGVDLGMPGYPVLLLMTGVTRIGQMLTDIGLSVLSVWCVARITQVTTADTFSGLVAGLIWAINPFSVFYAAVGTSETLFTALLLLGFVAYYRRFFGLGGLAISAATMTRPHIAILAPILTVVFSRVTGDTTIRQSARNVAVFAVCYLALAAPWWWHNYEKYHTFVPLNLGGGLVLYSGNNPMNRTGGGISWVDVDPTNFSDIADPVARDKAFRDAAVRYIRENPTRFIELAWLKFERLWRPWPYAKEYSSTALVVISAVSFIPVLLLAIVGAFLGWRRHDIALLPIFLFIGYTTAIHMVTIGSVRYRFPMEPFLVILAAPVIVSVIRRFLPTEGTSNGSSRVPT